MSSPTVQFLFDFGSPNAYFCHKVLPALERRTGVKVAYVPILLGGLFKLSNNRSPVESTADIPNKRAYDMLEMRRFVQKHGLNAYTFNPFFPVNTLAIMRGAVAAQRLGCFETYVDAVYAAMWEQGKNMGDPAVIQTVLQAAGLDAQVILEKSVDPDVKAQLLTNTQAAHDRGAFGSPTFFVGQEMYFGKDRLEVVEQEILRQQA
ncbi:MAG: 2-hydroxychromene-2-carboxylate isomerase [Rhodoferax sp.]